MKLLGKLLLVGATAGAVALVWRAATDRTPAGPILGTPPPESDVGDLSDEERDLLLRELAAHL